LLTVAWCTVNRRIFRASRSSGVLLSTFCLTPGRNTLLLSAVRREPPPRPVYRTPSHRGRHAEMFGKAKTVVKGDLYLMNSIRNVEIFNVIYALFYVYVLSVRLSVSQSVSLSVCLSVWLYVCMSVCLSVCLAVCMYVCLSVCMYVCLSVCLSGCMYVCLSVCMYVCLSVCLSCIAFMFMFMFLWA